MKVPVSYFDRSTSGQIMTRFVNDASSLTDFFQSGMISIVGNIFSVVAIYIGIYSLHHRMAWIMLLVFIPFFASCVFFSGRLRDAYEESRNQLSHFNSMLADFLYGMKTIRSLSLSFLKNQLLSKQIQNYSDSQVQLVREFAFFNPILSLGIGVLFLVLVLTGIPLVDSGEMKTGEWIAILSYIFMLQQPLMEITDRWNYFLAGVTSIQRIKNVFDEKEEKLKGAFALFDKDNNGSISA
jgi:ATP-binding cassette subfamily B protein